MDGRSNGSQVDGKEASDVNLKTESEAQQSSGRSESGDSFVRGL